tara:strand:- start:120 stop:1145 length:1026 start_codon:yes stop_codon:yes gene_type:complete
MNREVDYLGIDIGGAHLKIIGIDENETVRFVDYSSCRIWENLNNLKKKFLELNKLFQDKQIKCAITMSAELCDNFKNRRHGVSTLIKYCKFLNFDNYYYVKTSKTFLKKPNTHELISMNWHSIGNFFKKRIRNGIIIDFGSTTTDLLCIKDGNLLNESFDDFSRINNFELIYTGFTRTPLFGIAHEISIDNRILKIIPEFFSDTSDIYRVLKKLNKNIDLDRTADGYNKTTNNSLKRLSRSFGFDYNKNLKEKLIKICFEISSIQLNTIFDTIKKLEYNFDIKNFTIFTSGIGQDVLSDFLITKNYRTEHLHSFLKKSNLNVLASYHVPALSVALLLKDLR